MPEKQVILFVWPSVEILRSRQLVPIKTLYFTTAVQLLCNH